MRLRALAVILCLCSAPGLAQNQDPNLAGSKSVFGSNGYLSDGAMALMLGNYQRGIELTRIGLNDVLTTEERATSLSNLCAGYVGLKEYEVGLVYCTRSLQLVPNNWRALQNRAAARVGLNQVVEALRDIEQGLTVNPDSESLKLTLALVREHERRQNARRLEASGQPAPLALPAAPALPVTTPSPRPAVDSPTP